MFFVLHDILLFNIFGFQLGSVPNKDNKVVAGWHISPGVFYGSPHGVPPKKPSSLLRVLREIHLDLSTKRRSNLRYT